MEERQNYNQHPLTFPVWGLNLMLRIKCRTASKPGHNLPFILYTVVSHAPRTTFLDFWLSSKPHPEKGAMAPRRRGSSKAGFRKHDLGSAVPATSDLDQRDERFSKLRACIIIVLVISGSPALQPLLGVDDVLKSQLTGCEQTPKRFSTICAEREEFHQLSYRPD